MKDFIKKRNNPTNIPTISGTIPMVNLQHLQKPIHIPIPYSSYVASTSTLNPISAVLPGQIPTDENPQTTEVIAPKPCTASDSGISSHAPMTSISKQIAGTSILSPISAVLLGQVLTDESTQTTKSIVPKPYTTSDDVPTSYIPIPSTSKTNLGQGTTFLIPPSADVPGQIPTNSSTETTEPKPKVPKLSISTNTVHNTNVTRPKYAKTSTFTNVTSPSTKETPKIRKCNPTQIPFDDVPSKLDSDPSRPSAVITSSATSQNVSAGTIPLGKIHRMYR